MDDAYQALIYLEAVRRVLGPRANGPYSDFVYDYPMLHPSSFLLAHAIELSLTSYLRASGEKRGQSGHDLVRRLEAAEAIGFTPSQSFRRCVIAIAKSHNTMQFRFAKSDPAPFMSPRDALAQVLPDMEAIYFFVVDKVTGSAPGGNASPVGPL
ncbi:hypothetical protein GGD50_005045 [Rhizobium paranaense]|uniref:HEPN domain-containing protein n=2 Tax=Rhizobium/Agrobacterium group TaxID=227290 RepID=A0A7W8XVN9_9HYPH|nr:hypothetical protein [Rhizobium paranaense]PST62558.1 hypothetical protein C9E91_13535 [Rhizobium sp. SEMIA4064]